LALTADKAAKLGNDGATVALPSVSTTDTFIVPSKSDPKKPHIVNIHPNGKCECDNCHAYKASFICAHVIAACVKKSRLMDFLRWLVTSKRKTGGVNYSEAISFGMPKGRERKGEAAPRKRNNRKVTKQSVTVQIIPIENTPQVQPTSPTSPSINTSPSTKRTTTTTTPNISYTTITTTDRKFSGNDKFRTKPVPASLFVASAEYFTLYFLHALLSTINLALFWLWKPPQKFWCNQ
jgi:hypothetical protein